MADFTDITVNTGDWGYASLMNSYADNDKYLRERTDFAEYHLPKAGALNQPTSVTAWSVRVRFNGTTVVEWSHGSGETAYVHGDVDIAAIPDGLVTAEIQVSTPSIPWTTVTEFRLVKRQNLDLLSLFISIDADSAGFEAKNATLILHREAQAW